MATSIRNVQWNEPYRQVVPSYQAQNKQLNAAGWGGLAKYGQDVNGNIPYPSYYSNGGRNYPQARVAVPVPPRVPTIPTIPDALNTPSISMDGFKTDTVNPMSAFQMVGNKLPVYGENMQSLANVGSVNLNTSFAGSPIEGMSPYVPFAGNGVGTGAGSNNPTGMFGSLMETWGKYGKPLIGTAQDPGPLSAALGIGQGLFNVGLGLKSYNLAKDNRNLQKEAFAKNYGAQKESLVEDRGWQAARQAAREGKDYNAAKSAAMADWGKRLA